MKLDWQIRGGDGYAMASTGEYEIEQSSSDRWWVFADQKPIGVLDAFCKAQQRAEDVHNFRLTDKEPNDV